jgi:WD40 repeat protein/class 3 adenylate cyclase
MGNETRFAVLLCTDIVDSSALKARHGAVAFSEALRIHNGHVERLAHACLNPRHLQSRGDGYFAETGSVADAIRFALLFQDALRDGPWGEVRLTARVGIHAGEIGALEQEDGTWIVGLAADTASRVAGLAQGGQILTTRFPFDEARHFIREHPSIEGRPAPRLRWLAHGPYLLKGLTQPLEIFEVGVEGVSPLSPPPDSEKAKRAIRPGEEETLGWRPAIGLEIPGRPGWLLSARLGAGGFGEVWVGRQAKLLERRAFKFCFDDDRLRALKREVTLVRLLRTVLGDRDDIVRLHDLKLDQPPFYVESDLAPHGNLLQWAEANGGLGAIDIKLRIAIVAYTAKALGAAHSVGVLHKDIKPTNILIFDGPDGEPRPRLVDFGIGMLADPEVLRREAITNAGFTHGTARQSTGTPTYSPPEYIAGRPYTIQGDIYGLGVLLYQLVTAKPLEPLATGWERDVEDPLLREDIAACVDGDPARRLSNATELADRLLHLDLRRAEHEEQERLIREAAASAEAERKRREAEELERAERERREKVEAALREAAQARDEAEKSNRSLRLQLSEAAKWDRLLAEEKLLSGNERAAFAHLARACEYDPESTLAAEKAIALLNRRLPTKQMIVLRGHLQSVNSVNFSPNGSRAITGSSDTTARIWDTRSGFAISIIRGHELSVTSAQYSLDGSWILTTAGDKSARIWNATDFRLIASLSGHQNWVWSAQISPDATRIITASMDKTLRLWDAQTFTLLQVLPQEEIVWSTSLSPDGRRLVTGSHDCKARIWDTDTGKLVHTLSGHKAAVKCVQFDVAGSRILTASEDRTTRIWDAHSGAHLATLAGHMGRVTSARFSHDGRRVVTSSFDKLAKIWDPASGKLIATLLGHTNCVSCAQYSPDDSKIITGSRDGSGRIWTVLPPAYGPPPSWFPDFLRYMAQNQLNPDGELEQLHRYPWLKIEESLRELAYSQPRQTSPYLTTLRSFILPRF